ncbi:hypothetical protein [Algibacter lectus]|uniref:Uncharacterized protein n=1 Tax=Algibacter lectus TaxID=221126 RepID=A0A090WMN4_9FLAO|nr:hypothetical protein [Algibacter lectus]MDO7137693.1 hypothetical protein [Algibacter lectus]MWW25576.1 hypothetical protein [Algibacter lectus]TDY61523.1 hypothetical protein DFQ06_2861 [Algibacter lectus]SFD12690.1 hypothetical protein SAMN04489722_105240 [Algibacter lectus]GAL64024.1 hypothetical protein JCM19300_3227 [Algibacter lectus]
MDINKDIQQKIDSTLQAVDGIETVNVSPFFKDKTMQRLFSEKEEVVVASSWFTPKLQLATLACVVVLNVLAFTQLDNSSGTSSYDENLNQFAETYGLSSSSTTSFLN